MSRDSYRKYRFERQGIRVGVSYSELVEQQQEAIMGANLYDFLDPVNEKPMPRESDLKEAVKLQTMVKSLSDFSYQTVSRSETDGINSMLERFKKNLLIQQVGILEKYFHLPEELINPSTVPGLLANTPVINTKDIKAIAEQFGFIIIPFEYMAEKAYSKEEWSLKRSILNFNTSCSSIFSVYVLCPISYYDVQKHISSEDDKAIYAPKDAAQAFMAINMLIPSLRIMSSEIKNLKGRVDILSKEVTNLSRRVDDLAVQVERARQENIAHQAELERQLKAAEELNRRIERQESFISYDPLMFAIPKKINLISQDSLAFVGPCWGPEIDNVVLSALKIKKKEKQRQEFTSLALRWRG